MGKILGSWSGMRKYLEQDMLAESLRGRVRYGCTAYVGMDGCRIFEIYIDKEPIKRFSWETVNSYFIDSGYKSDKNPSGIGEYWREFWPLLDKYPLTDRTEYTDGEFSEALEKYRNQDIRESLQSNNPIIRMFAILDRRVGKRTLMKVKDTVEEQPLWLKQFYYLRLAAEEISFLCESEI